MQPRKKLEFVSGNRVWKWIKAGRKLRGGKVCGWSMNVHRKADAGVCGAEWWKPERRLLVARLDGVAGRRRQGVPRNNINGELDEVK